MSRGGRRRRVRRDLQQPDWPERLINAGFDSSIHTAWIVEGLIPYLTNGAAEQLLTAVGRHSSTGSRLALDHAGSADDALLIQARAMPSMAGITAMWKGGLGDDAALWLAHQGWEPQTIHGESLSRQYERGTAAGMHGVFVTAKRTA